MPHPWITRVDKVGLIPPRSWGNRRSIKLTIGIDEVGRGSPLLRGGSSNKWIVGIDEVGRGALAGPLTVAAVAASVDSPWFIANSQLPDSKRLTAHRREQIASDLRRQPNVFSSVVSIDHQTIDRVGITEAARVGVRRALLKLSYPLVAMGYNPLVLLDGGLAAPAAYRQLTVVRGDAQLPIIAAASIFAKVHRDRHMIRQHRRFPRYRFDLHKGYGTRVHFLSLRLYGPSLLHRRTFRLFDK